MRVWAIEEIFRVIKYGNQRQSGEKRRKDKKEKQNSNKKRYDIRIRLRVGMAQGK